MHPLGLLILALMSCRPDTDPVKDTADSTQETDTETDSDSDTDTPPSLDASHRGWRDPLCWVCHIPDTHNTGLDPYECAACHGGNGAQECPHPTRSSCVSCHTPHASTGFPDPESCLACH